ncbi:type IV secretory system conjugative DNA transfer VirD4/TraG family protein [Aquimarina sp. MAR_2010_214]|uniref:type IV secretory system conjugative DNA transfer family protein n=1 Tax=Aquimarina sp. MAR_2010_214 TaxID=1250026 RepID=UPI000C7138AC|nr:type IV secretory system conjugative DNA transfer family protein [Aquimarina sp. MAR_2010_214]PKV49223.1 type IV secretory system conjugative DNA transfer VirD4/TraG family protein [Aquimarina sp. MAR_2010_214]
MKDINIIEALGHTLFFLIKIWTVYSCYLFCKYFKIHYAFGVLIYFFPLVNLLVTVFPFYYWINKLVAKKNIDKINDIEVADSENSDNSESLSFKTEKGIITIDNIYRNIYVQGGAGAGKSKSVIEPTIIQSAKNEMAGVFYDFKAPSMSEKLLYEYKDSTKVSTFFVDFKDPSRSNRVNPISPKYLLKSAHAFELSQTLIQNLLPETIKQREYFDREAQSILTGVMWYMRNNHPEYCTIPHIISMFLHVDIEKIIEMVGTDTEASGMISSLRQAMDRKANKLVASVMSTLQNALSTLNNPEIFWILSGNDFSLNLNDPSDPKFMCIGNDSTLSATYAPVISLILSSTLRLMNQEDKYKSTIIIDEAPTIFIPRLTEFLATARSNKISTIYAAQDYGQIEAQNGKEAAQSILSNLGTQIYGRTANVKTAEMIKSIFSKQDRTFVTTSQNDGKSGGLAWQLGRSKSKGQNESIQERDRVKVTDIMNLDKGEFYGIVAEGTPREFLKTKFLISEQPEIKHTYNIKTPEEYFKRNYNNIINEVLGIAGIDQKEDGNLINF